MIESQMQNDGHHDQIETEDEHNSHHGKDSLISDDQEIQELKQELEQDHEPEHKQDFNITKQPMVTKQRASSPRNQHGLRFSN